jgi:SAM-dependent methyltransferase
MTHISIDQYDQMHDAALAHVGNDVIWAFTPVTFGANGYPSTVTREAQLIRYADPMKEHLSRNLSDRDQFLRLYSLRTRFTADEAKLIIAIRERVARLCEARYGRRVVPINSAVCAMGLFRVLSAIANCYPNLKRPLSVLEVGPGSGYLGSLLIDAGFQYAASDSTQAFYLWQNRLFAAAAGDEVVEQALVPIGAAAPVGRITHIPWWHFVTRAFDMSLDVDVVVCEQALCEMHAWAMRYTLRAAKHALRHSDVRAFVFSGHGHPQNSVEDVERSFAETGFKRILGENVFCYVPSGHGIPSSLSRLDKEIPLFNPGHTSELLAPSEFLKVSRAELPLDYEFRRLVGLWPGAELFVE